MTAIVQHSTKTAQLESDFSVWMRQVRADIATSLWEFLPAASSTPTKLHQAMCYAVLDGGKRVRPLLVFAAGELFITPAAIMQRVAAAVEMIHTYSLVHDDMPCMDNNTLRRRKPTVHMKYDDATALLAGDALQAQAFVVLSETDITGLDIARQIVMVRLLAQASSSLGMCGGQAIDLASVGMSLSLAELEKMHKLKTGALLCVSVLLGAWGGKTLVQDEIQALEAYGAAIGLAFQVVDDILDATIDSVTLGKTAGKDASDNKPTYVSILGLSKSQALVEKLCNDAHQALVIFGDRACRLRELADLIAQRKV